MMNLFSFIEANGMFRDQISFFDWLFAEKFDDMIWSNSIRLGSLAKRLKKNSGVSEARFSCDA